MSEESLRELYNDGGIRLVQHDRHGYTGYEIWVGDHFLTLLRDQMLGISMAAINSLVSSPEPIEVPEAMRYGVSQSDIAAARAALAQESPKATRKYAWNRKWIDVCLSAVIADLKDKDNMWSSAALMDAIEAVRKRLLERAKP